MLEAQITEHLSVIHYEKYPAACLHVKHRGGVDGASGGGRGWYG